MICDNCGIEIDPKFKAAISKNKCPACESDIMKPEKMASLLSLKELLNTNFKELDADKVASLIVANFEVKQFFKVSGKKEVDEKKEAPIQEVEETIEEEESEDVKSDKEYKKQQLKDSREILKKMRDEALNEAEADYWGLGNADLMGGESIREVADQEIKSQRLENILSGSKGSFRRSE